MRSRSSPSICLAALVAGLLVASACDDGLEVGIIKPHAAAGAAAGSSGSGGGHCTLPDRLCTGVWSRCLALVRNAGLLVFTLRVASLDFQTPDGLKGVLDSGVEMNLHECSLMGGGTFNLLYQFDAVKQTLKLGGAYPTLDPSLGYAFVNEVIHGVQVAPVSTNLTPGADGYFTTGAGVDVVIPIYVAVTDAEPGVILPLRSVKVTGTLHDSNTCVGTYGCVSAYTSPVFTDAGFFDGHILLEDADAIILPLVGKSLCVLISGDASTYGDGGTPAKCKRTGGIIDFKGDFCHLTNMPAGAGCSDSSRVHASFAASAVKLNP